MDTGSGPKIVILGGGFGGVYVARHLQRLLARDTEARITLVSRNNYFTMTPLLFEAGSGVLEPRHAVNPLRKLFKRVQFMEAEIAGIDIDNQCIELDLPGEEHRVLPYDHLVIALGGVVNRSVVPGSEDALTFKTLADAIYLRNHCIQILERANSETNADKKAALLTFIIIGAGLVGLELMGELTMFLRNAIEMYPNLNWKQCRFMLIEGGPRIVPELDSDLSDYASRVLQKRGVEIRVNSPVKGINNRIVQFPDDSKVAASTIVVATGVLPSPLVASLKLQKDRKGRALTEPTMLCVGRKDVWALGDCASIPDPDGKPYPPLAQHALREAKRLATNLVAQMRGQPLQPFLYQSKGTLAALGHYKGVGRVKKWRIHGFIAWWVWRTYYVFQMPRWDRRLRILLDWTVALIFKNDVVQLDLKALDARTEKESHERRYTDRVDAVAAKESAMAGADC